MKKHMLPGTNALAKSFFAIAFMILSIYSANAQCTWSGQSSQLTLGTPPCGTFSSSSSVGSGTYTYFNGTQGSSYTFSTCNDGSNTQLTVYWFNGSAWVSQAYNDDNGPICNTTRASITWTNTNATSGNYILVLNEFNCQQHTGISHVLDYRENGPAAPSGNPTGGTSICSGAGTNVTLNRNSTPPTGLTYYWQTSSTGTSTSIGSGSTLTVSPSSTTTYYVRPQSGTGCWGTASAGTTITVNTTPSPPTAPTAQTVCASSAQNISFNSVTAGANGDQIEWATNSSFTGSTTVASPATITVNVAVGTTTTVYMRSRNSSSGCVSTSVNTTATVNANPTAPTAPTAQAVCSNSSQTLTFPAISAGSGGNQIEWATNSSFTGSTITASPATVSVSVSSGSTTTVYFRSRASATGCVSTSVNSTATVNPVPAAPVAPAAQSTCSGSTQTFAFTSVSSGFGGDQIEWATNGGFTGSTVATSPTTITVNVPSGTTTNIFIRSRNSTSGCVSTSVSTSASVSSVPGATITVTEASGTTANDGVTCSGDAVSLTANPAGMTSYVWNNGLPNGQNQTVNPTGTTTYSVTVTNSSSCTAVATTTITVNPLPTPTISVVESSGNVNNDGTTCSGDNVTLTANPGGLTYSWSGGLGAAQVQNVAPTGTTVYTVTVTNGNACSNTVSATITVNPLPATTISVVESSGNSSNDGTTCSGDNVTLTANPSAQLSYAWNNSLPSQQVNVVAPTGTTSYSVTVTTVNNCSAAASATITVNPLPTPTIGVAETSGVANNDGIICSAAAVTLTGSAGFTNYAWNNALGSGQVKNVAPTATTTYTVTVTNSNNCSAAASTTITVNQYPIFSAQPVVTAVLCNGGNTGTITVSASTANNPLTYSNDNGSTFQGSNVFTGLTAGSYNLVITDAAACSTTYPTNPVLVTEPPVLTHTTAVVDASCSNVFDGKITVTATGGFGAYAYSLNGGPSQVGNVFSGLSSGVYTVLTTDANGCGFSTSDTIDNSYGITGSIQSQTNVSCFSGGNGAVTVQIDSFGVSPYSYSINGVTFQPGGITYTFTGLTAGNYIVTIRDSKGCSAFVPVTITQPAQLQAQIDSITNIACNGGGTGAIYISVNGGTAPFSYLWSNSATTQDITGLVAGTYNVAVLDANGCNASVGATITQPIALFLNVASYTNLRCFNDSSGSINVSVNGGVPPYNFNWSNGATTEDLSGLKANTYSLTVTDNNGCTQTASQTITEPLQLTTSASSANVTCNGFTNGSIDLTVSNGTGPYTYFWANGGYTTEDLNGIGAGSYTVVVTDANSCTASRTVVITQPAALVVSGTVTNLGCFGNTSGAIDVTVTGGTPVYVYQWSNGLPATEDQTGLNAGTYTVTVVDDFVCTASASFTLTQPTQALGGSLVATDVTCNGANNGSVNLTLTGGTLPYIYTWAPGGATTEDITGLGPNTYSVTAQDANGCSFTGNATVAEPAALVASIQGTDVSCFGGNNGAADLTVTGGNLGYTYLWSNFASTEDLTGLTAGTYTVIVTDTKSCQTITAVTITQPAQLVINGNVTNISCNGGTTGSVDLTVTGGAGQYSFAWSGGLPATEDQASLTAGTYTVTVTDANFCTASASYTITQPVALVVSGVSTNVSCNGGSNGTVNLTVNGGVAPYVFNWSPNGQTTEDLSGLSANTYSVTVTDANTCSGTASFVITEPAAITSSVAGTDVTCNGASNGSADLTVSGGTGPYTYLWSNFQATQDLANIGGGLYYVIIKDANGCEKRDSVLISEPAALVIASSVTNISCNGGTTGSVDLTVTGGTGAYSFAWSGGLPATEDQTGLTAGTYVVTVSDANSCTATASYTITQPVALVVSGVSTNVSCNGGSNGTVNLTVSGGVAPYIFNWSPNGQTTEDLSGLSANTYSVTVTDANTCSGTASFVITEPAAITSSVAGTDVTCNGASNGSADLTVSGGTGPYTYLWSNFQATQDLANIGGGLYYVIIKDANGCEKRDSVLISEPAALVIASSVTNVLCNGAATGAIDLTVTGGTGAYSFAWSGGLPATEDQTGLTAGTYVVTVSDANSCTATATYTITQPAGLVLNATTTNVGCAGGANGSVDITVQGGVFPYSFNWSPNGQTTEDINGLSGGTYTVVITDANGCSTSASYTITEPSAIVSSVVGTDVTCNGASNGSADLTVSGGTGPYTYLWSNFQATQDLANIGGGLYYVVIKDANGCEKRDSVLISEPAALVIASSVTNVLCNGAATGAIDLTVTGGTGAYSFAWSGGLPATEDQTGLTAGTYVVTVSDANSCTATASYTITQPVALVVSGVSTNVSCNGGSNGTVNLTVSGGVAPYIFNWSPNGQTTEDLSGLSANTYSVTVTDANTCSGTASFVITEPAAITSSVAGTDVTCNGASNGSADLTVSGGTGPYTYLWSNFQATQDLANIGGGLYYVIIKDANGCEKRDSVLISEPAALVIASSVTNVLCNGAATGAIDLTVTGGTGAYSFAWSGGLPATEDQTGLTAGTYVVTVSDANSCTATATYTITQPAGLVLNATTTNVGCAGGANGSVDITVQGGVFPYSFNWSPNGQTTEDINGLSGGTYTVVITDANGCSTSASYTITEPNAIVSSVVGTDVTCNGASNGSADLTVSGGTGPYTYLWSTFEASQDIANLDGGLYYVIITDANGCEKRDSVLINEPTAIVASTSVTNVLCNGGSTGVIDLTVTGGSGAYTFAWSGNLPATEDQSGVAAGTYTVTITDGNSCTATASATITQPALLSLTGLVTNVSCAGGNDGQINTTVVGGTLPYTFVWSNGPNTEDVQTLTAGTYSVVVTDANGCSTSASYTITEPTPIVSSIVGTNVTCQGANNGTADLTVSGGTAPYTYFWSNFQASQDVNGLDGGIYFVVITDANGCTHRDSVVISEPSQLVLSTAVTQISCFNANDGAIDLTVTGGTQPYQYAWSNNLTTEDISGLSGNTYSVVVTDDNGCTATIAALIINPANIGTNVVTHNPLCNGDTNGRIDLITTGGTPNYSFLWSNGATTEDINNIGAGVYSITITDARGCVHTDSFTIVEPGPLFTSGFIKNVTCFGFKDGCVDITAYGGTLPYQYLWSTGQSTEDICGLSGGLPLVTVTDFNGCSVVSSYQVFEPALLTLDVTATNVSCFNGTNGTATALPAGGTTPYEYLWDDFASDSLRTGLPAGRVVLLLTDSNGCHVLDSAIITQPTEVAITGLVNNAACFNAATGGVDITVTGGTPAYTYFWSSGATTEDLTAVAAGPYTVTVTDANLCNKSATFTVTQPMAINLTLLSNKPACNGANNGSLSVVAVQGVTPYTYAWSDGQTTATAADLAAGAYSVTVNDANGCSATIADTLTAPQAITVTTNVQGSKCFNTSTGVVTATVTGGRAPYVYQLNGASQPTNVFAGLAAGNYILLVTDANGCQGTSAFTITSPGQISVDLTVAEQIILTGMKTQLSATATSDKAIIGYAWQPSAAIDFSGCGDTANCSNPYAAPLSSTIFTVTVMNEDSCTATDTITVYVDNELSEFIPSAFTPNNDGLNDRFAFDILGATNLDIKIFNRWGQEVYGDANQPNGLGAGIGWDGNVDGKPAPNDTYIWQLKVTYFGGDPSRESTKETRGTVSIMR